MRIDINTQYWLLNCMNFEVPEGAVDTDSIAMVLYQNAIMKFADGSPILTVTNFVIGTEVASQVWG